MWPGNKKFDCSYRSWNLYTSARNTSTCCTILLWFLLLLLLLFLKDFVLFIEYAFIANEFCVWSECVQVENLSITFYLYRTKCNDKQNTHTHTHRLKHTNTKIYFWNRLRQTTTIYLYIILLYANNRQTLHPSPLRGSNKVTRAFKYRFQIIYITSATVTTRA